MCFIGDHYLLYGTILCSLVSDSLQPHGLHGILQAILECSLFLLQGIFLDWTQVSCIAGRFFTLWATREAQNINYRHNNIYNIKYRQFLIMYLLNIYTYIYVLCIYMCMYMYVYMCVHTHIYVHMHICTIHVCSSSLDCPFIALMGTIVKPISVPVSRWL